jgi:cytochrome b561
VLLGLLALHVGAVVWHAIVKRENILPRMWFGARRGDPGEVRDQSSSA